MSTIAERYAVISVLDTVAAALEVGLAPGCAEAIDYEQGLYLPPPTEVVITGSRISADDTPSAGRPVCYVFQSRPSTSIERKTGLPSGSTEILRVFVEARIEFVHAPQASYEHAGRRISRDTEFIARREHHYGSVLRDVLRCVCGAGGIQRAEIDSDYPQQIALSGAQALMGRATVVAALDIPIKRKTCGG